MFSSYKWIHFSISHSYFSNPLVVRASGIRILGKSGQFRIENNQGLPRVTQSTVHLKSVLTCMTWGKLVKEDSRRRVLLLLLLLLRSVRYRIYALSSYTLTLRDLLYVTQCTGFPSVVRGRGSSETPPPSHKKNRKTDDLL
jgi:hypothetical protein